MTSQEYQISKYKSAFGVDNVKVSIKDEIASIANGKYKSAILDCRLLLNSGDKDGYNALKKKLPAVTFSGTFSGAHRKENLENYSKHIVIDIDNLKNSEVEQKKQQLYDDKYVFATWISPSGRGVKLLIRVHSSPEDHALCFLCLSEYFKSNYEIEVDKSGSDICRLCFVSHDSNILYKDISQEFDFKNHLALIEGPKEISKTTSVKATLQKHFDSGFSKSKKKLFFATEGKNSGKNRATIEKIIKYLRKNNKSITSTYNDWFRVALAIANSFTHDVGQKYYLELCELDKGEYNEYKSRYLLDYCYLNRKLDVISFSTIIYLAKQQGFQTTFPTSFK